MIYVNKSLFSLKMLFIILFILLFHRLEKLKKYKQICG
jgi:hypothetical protein